MHYVSEKLYGDRPPPGSRENETAAGAGTEAAEEDHYKRTNSCISPQSTQEHHNDAAEHATSLEKWGAVALYTHHILPLEAVARMFQTNPHGRAA